MVFKVTCLNQARIGRIKKCRGFRFLQSFERGTYNSIASCFVISRAHSARLYRAAQREASVSDVSGNTRTHVPGPSTHFSNEVRIHRRGSGASFFHRFGDHG
jgi:hypothetical protein